MIFFFIQNPFPAFHKIVLLLHPTYLNTLDRETKEGKCLIFITVCVHIYAFNTLTVTFYIIISQCIAARFKGEPPLLLQLPL